MSVSEILSQRFRPQFGQSIEEQLQWLNRVSADRNRQVSRNACDLMRITHQNGVFQLEAPNRPGAPITARTRREAERHLKRHYLQVAERLREACHY